jgi:hypothetical protein
MSDVSQAETRPVGSVAYPLKPMSQKKVESRIKNAMGSRLKIVAIFQTRSFGRMNIIATHAANPTRGRKRDNALKGSGK